MIDTPEMIKIAKMVRTSTACPSQWDAWDVDGRYYYIRYRNGHLRIDGDVGGRAMFAADHGDELNGFMELAELQTLTAQQFDFSGADVTGEPGEDYWQDFDD